MRGLAILMVLAYHFANSLLILGLKSPILSALTLGWCGVDVFFALSGFLITGILLDTRASPHFFQSFYARRVLRIFPLYFTGLLATALFGVLAPSIGAPTFSGGLFAPHSLLWPALFLENLALFLARHTHSGLLAHYWSLAVEEHFYLVWPLLVWLSKSRRQVLALALLATVLSIAGRALVLACGIEINHVFSLTPLRLDGLGIGAAAAVIAHGGARALAPRLWAPPLIGSLALLALITAWRGALEQTDPALWITAYPLVSLATAATIVLSLTVRPLAVALGAGVLRWFGKYSFGLYVWHPLIGVALMHSSLAIVHAGERPAALLAKSAFIFGLDLAVCWLSFHLLEKRFLSLKRFFTPGGTRRGAVADAALEAPVVEASGRRAP